MSVSDLHERRVQLLTMVAVMAGCRTDARLDVGLFPDVAMLDRSRARLFVGDAKATEQPGCAATARRLRRYFRATQPWLRGGYTVRVALCVGRRATFWERTLLRVATETITPVAAHGHVAIGTREALVWADLTGPTRRPVSSAPPGPAASSAPVNENADPPCRGDGILVLPHPLD